MNTGFKEFLSFLVILSSSWILLSDGAARIRDNRDVSYTDFFEIKQEIDTLCQYLLNLKAQRSSLNTEYDDVSSELTDWEIDQLCSENVRFKRDSERQKRSPGYGSAPASLLTKSEELDGVCSYALSGFYPNEWLSHPYVDILDNSEYWDLNDDQIMKLCNCTHVFKPDPDFHLFKNYLLKELAATKNNPSCSEPCAPATTTTATTTTEEISTTLEDSTSTTEETPPPPEDSTTTAEQSTVTPEEPPCDEEKTPPPLEDSTSTIEQSTVTPEEPPCDEEKTPPPLEDSTSTIEQSTVTPEEPPCNEEKTPPPPEDSTTTTEQSTVTPEEPPCNEEKTPPPPPEDSTTTTEQSAITPEEPPCNKEKTPSPPEDSTSTVEQSTSPPEDSPTVAPCPLYKKKVIRIEINVPINPDDDNTELPSSPYALNQNPSYSDLMPSWLKKLITRKLEAEKKALALQSKLFEILNGTDW